MNQTSADRHLPADDLAAYLDRRLDDSERAVVEAHLAWCDECRAEFREVSAIVRGGAVKPRRLAWIGPVAAAAAAIVLLVAQPWSPGQTDDDPVHRDTPSVADRAPSLGAPTVATTEPGVFELHWSRVQRADRYRVIVYDSTGGVVWRAETRDTSVHVPATADLSPEGSYLWRVDARIGIDRWMESELRPLALGGPIDAPADEEPTP